VTVFKRSRKSGPKVGTNSSGAKDAAFGDGTSEVEREFALKAKNAPENSEGLDKVDDRAPTFPEWVEVIDAKHANVIGFQPKEKVMALIANDPRFQENITTDNVFQLFYDTTKVRNNFIQIELNSFEEYYNHLCHAVRENPESVSSCDDPRLLLLSATFERGGRWYVITLPWKKAKDVMPMVCKRLRRAITKNTPGVIEYLGKNR
jgi:hypothetical protein